jgi:hypothetical protein
MKSVRTFILWVGAMCLAIMLTLQTMRAMLVHDDATIFLAAPVCSAFSKPVKDGFCTVQGSVSYNFVGSDVEINLANNSLVLINEKYVHGLAYTSGSARYEPFGKAGAVIVAILILLMPNWLLLGAKGLRRGTRNQVAGK